MMNDGIRNIFFTLDTKPANFWWTREIEKKNIAASSQINSFVLIMFHAEMQDVNGVMV